VTAAPRKSNAEAIAWLLDHCQPQLSVWELDFLDNIRDTIGRVASGALTVDQAWVALQAALGRRTVWLERG